MGFTRDGFKYAIRLEYIQFFFCKDRKKQAILKDNSGHIISLTRLSSSSLSRHKLRWRVLPQPRPPQGENTAAWRCIFSVSSTTRSLRSARTIDSTLLRIAQRRAGTLVFEPFLAGNHTRIPLNTSRGFCQILPICWQ